MKTRIAVVIMAAMLLVGCAGTKLVCNPRPDKNLTYDDFTADNYACAQQSQTGWSGGGTGWMGIGAMHAARRNAHGQAKDMYRMCMEARGWVVTEEKER
jgi:hypothetical protein